MTGVQTCALPICKSRKQRHIVFSKAQKIIKCNVHLLVVTCGNMMTIIFYMHVSYLARSVVLVKTSGDSNLFSDVIL